MDNLTEGSTVTVPPSVGASEPLRSGNGGGWKIATLVLVGIILLGCVCLGACLFGTLLGRMGARWGGMMGPGYYGPMMGPENCPHHQQNWDPRDGSFRWDPDSEREVALFGFSEPA